MSQDLKDRGLTDGNKSPELNNAQKLYNREVKFRPYKGGKIKGGDGASYDSSPEDDVDDDELDDEELDSTERDRESISNQEGEGDSSLYNESKPSSSPRRTGRVRGFLKKYGATTGIAGLMIGGFSGASFLLAPGALLVAMEKAITNDSSDFTRTNILMRRAYMGGLMSNKKCNYAVTCRVTTISEKQKLRWEKQGFTLATEDVGGRHKIKTITFPDGKQVSSARDFNNHAENTVSGRLASSNVLDLRSAYFQNSKFKNVLDKWRIAKSKHLKTSNSRDKEEQQRVANQSFDENSEAETGDDEQRKTSIRDKLKEKYGGPARTANEKFKSVGGAISGTVNSIVAYACAAKTALNIGVATVQAKWISDLVLFAFPFVQAAAQIEDQGNIKPETVEILSDRLTWFMTEEHAEKLMASGEDPLANQKINQTAMDSQGLQMAIYGDFTKLKEITEAYTVGAISGKFVGAASSTADVIEGALGGKENVRQVCLGNTVAGIGIGLAGLGRCGVGGPATAALCAAMAGGGFVVGAIWGDDLITWLIEQYSDDAIAAIADANLNSTLKGVDAGNALAAGIGLLVARGSLGYGMRPAASVAAVESFISKTDDINYTYTEQLAIDEAKQDPFDATNQYSFIGQLATSFNPVLSNDKSPFSWLANTLTVATTPLANSPTAGALFSHPSNMTLTAESADNRLAKCTNTQIHDIGGVCDWSGRIVGVTTDNVIGQAAGQANDNNNMVFDNIEWMIANGMITEEGATKEDSDYAKYKEFCTEERVDAMGTSTHPVEEEGQGWFFGDNCIGADKNDGKLQTKLDNFAIYLNICESQFPTAENDLADYTIKTCADKEDTSTPAEQAPADEAPEEANPEESAQSENDICQTDTTEAPDLEDHATQMKEICQKEMPRIEQLLSTAHREPPFTIQYTEGTTTTADGQKAPADAQAGKGLIRIQPSYVRKVPGDVGLMVHELTHLTQAYTSGAGWITEGIADYIRYTLGYAYSSSDWGCRPGSHYTDGYGCAATLIRYVEREYTSTIVKDLHNAGLANQTMESVFREKTGKDAATLYGECLTSDCSGGDSS